MTYDFSKSFIALAAPSLEGKTQFAFCWDMFDRFILHWELQKVLLYLILPSLFTWTSKLNKAIKKCADEDLTTIRNNSRTDLEQSIIKVCQTEAHNIEADKLCRVTTDELKVFQSNTKLLHLDFWCIWLKMQIKIIIQTLVPLGWNTTLSVKHLNFVMFQLMKFLQDSLKDTVYIWTNLLVNHGPFMLEILPERLDWNAL